MPAVEEAVMKRIDVEANIRKAMIEAVTRIKSELKKHDLEMNVIVEQPKLTAFFNIRHLSDNHIIGFLRAFAFAPIIGTDEAGFVKLAGFSILLQLHIDEKDYSLPIEEKSLLQTKPEQKVFEQKISSFIMDCIKQWSK